ncbi:MAG TPA: hypothetical protein VHY33_06730 [Thermoanaerobaculia bacterium]|jgi:hypothetical protein|nr:hypothetical protein [Thermoanaerobaculia bacterium]
MDVLIRLRKATVKELEEQAKENNRSLEAELKALLDEWAERSAAGNTLRVVRPGRRIF